MFAYKDAIGWIGDVAVFADGNGGYWLVKNFCNPMHITGKEETA